MKDSGIEWIGEIPDNWKVSKIKYICSIVRGGSPRPIENYLANDNEENYNWIRIGDTKKGYKYIDNTHLKIIPAGLAKTRLVHKGTLLLTNSMSFGEPYILNIDGCIHDGWLAFYNYINIEKEYLYYYLMSEACKNQFTQSVSGALVFNLNIEKVRQTILPLPPIDEQKKIADYLDDRCSKIDEIITGTTASIEDYKKLKQAIITEAVTKGLNKDVPMKDSGVEWIGEIPREWKVLLLKFLCNMQAGKNLVSEDISDSGEYPVYGGNGLRGYFSKYNTEGLNILVGRQGALCGNVHMVDGQYWCTEHAVVTTPSSLVALDYLYFLLIAMDLNQYSSNTAVQPGLSVNKILNIKTVLPPLDEQKEIANYLDKKIGNIDDIITEKTGLIEDLKKYKKSLIYEVVTGKKRI